ncbi:CPBP family intramembrane metalloprotease [Lactobacillus sp. S2-2]|uniref:CPBP family intramembrane glutamic endopeptidase n=1 Tax=Lactobacillus sp. S2-2 TaxID=2692917 RepID=UPI001F2F0F69|nr:type II CAAX endopeptidase family protein [Lactobacillus sp. S2-2]MCF6515177.1 CPBP family intramembrane metalloprotease [Lactobacillus sp. S2-2]
MFKKNKLDFFSKIIIFVLMIMLIQVVQIPILFIVNSKAINLESILFGLLYIILFVIGIWISLYVFKHNDGKLNLKLKLNHYVMVLVAYFSFMIVQIILNTLNYSFFNETSTANNQSIETLLGSNQIVLIVMMISMIFLSPILEETIFRGIFINFFFKPTQFYLPIILSGFLFSLFHQSDTIISFLMYACLGSILAYLYKKTGNLKVSILLHFVNNLIAGIILIFG